ncbi:TerD family protein, partial [Streptomyces sp. YIM 98790]|uniref:TerD family protein n=1 Tax=Streptomyces sp. YIM 98790 TaxID=2689077 RepID=UPI0014086161
MTPGANIPLPVRLVSVEVTAPRPLDVSGLMVAADGKVRSDADFIFYNQPEGPGVKHRPASPSGPDCVTVDTAGVPADIDKVVITASLDGGGPFAGMEPTATVRDAADGTVLAVFTPPALSVETALIVVEVYRRQGAWKVRAVGQGYANGLAGIAMDFGVAVEEEEQPEPLPSPAVPPAPAAPSAPGAPVSPAAPAAPEPAPAWATGPQTAP